MDEPEIFALADAFEQATLPVDAWSHAAHLTTALVFVRRFGPDGAFVVMRLGLLRYLASVGDTSAYHETITRARIGVIAAFEAERRDAPLADVAAELVERCARRDYLHRHYSPERLTSAEARASWLPPDRLPIG